jgi:hypothetical protein
MMFVLCVCVYFLVGIYVHFLGEFMLIRFILCVYTLSMDVELM